jgi:hypothetical protein
LKWIELNKGNYNPNYTCEELHHALEALKKPKKKKMFEEKKENVIDNLVLNKRPKCLNIVECRLVDDIIKGEYGDCFPFKSKPIKGMKVEVEDFSLH